MQHVVKADDRQFARRLDLGGAGGAQNTNGEQIGGRQNRGGADWPPPQPLERLSARRFLVDAEINKVRINHQACLGQGGAKTGKPLARTRHALWAGDEGDAPMALGDQMAGGEEPARFIIDEYSGRLRARNVLVEHHDLAAMIDGVAQGSIVDMVGHE